MFLRNVLVIFGILFVLAGIVMAMSLLRGGASSDSQTAQSSAVETPAVADHEILITALPLKAGTLLRESDIEWKKAKPEDINPGAILRGQAGSENILGAITRRDFTEGETLLAADLVMPYDRQFLAAVLKPGNRAVSISVNAPQSSSGLVLPGDYVDVILTQNLGDGVVDLSRRSVAETILRNVRVIAVDRQLSKPSKTEAVIEETSGSSTVPKTVTLELNELGAEKLFVATQLGTLQLSVRSLATLSEQNETTTRRAPTWASDASPALKEFAGKPVIAPQKDSTLGIESLIRRPPSTYQ